VLLVEVPGRFSFVSRYVHGHYKLVLLSGQQTLNFHFLHELRFYSPEAGFKARHDAYLIMNSNSRIKVVEIPLWGNIASRATKLVTLSRFLVALRKEDVLVFNFPLLNPFWHVLSLAKTILKFRLVPLIHDVDTLRGGKGNDVAKLAKCDLLISQNEVMTNFLVSSKILKSQIENLEIFDYLVKDESLVSQRLVSRQTKQHREIIFAGNLHRKKCGFIYDIEESAAKLTLFGAYYSGTSQNSYHGSFDPADPTPLLRDGIVFGLVWDGDSLETCSGRFGNYLSYNSPHKTSLYLAMGIPVLVWQDAAISRFITSNKLGYAISNISHAMKIVGEIELSEYQRLKKNSVEMSGKIRSGFYLNRVMEKIIKRSHENWG